MFFDNLFFFLVCFFCAGHVVCLMEEKVCASRGRALANITRILFQIIMHKTEREKGLHVLNTPLVGVVGSGLFVGLSGKPRLLKPVGSVNSVPAEPRSDSKPVGWKRALVCRSLCRGNNHEGGERRERREKERKGERVHA